MAEPSRVSAAADECRPATIRIIAAGIVAGVLVAGFWHVRFVDGLGVQAFVTPVIGAFEGKAEEFETRGAAFGLLFAVVAGLAATWTASNCAGFAMLPVLLLSNERSATRVSPWAMVGVLGSAVFLVGAVYGAFFGRLGPEGAAAFNVGPIRSAQSFAVFNAIGIVMLGWALIEAGLASSLVRHVSPVTRAFLSQPLAKAALAGGLIGAFSIGRPLAVFREALVYAAQPAVVSYAAFVTGLAALATVTGLAVALLLAARGGAGIDRWVARTAWRSQVLAAGALAAGGAFLICYWGVSRIWPAMGRWGFTLGLYG